MVQPHNTESNNYRNENFFSIRGYKFGAGSRLRAFTDRSPNLPKLSSLVFTVFRNHSQNYPSKIAGLQKSSLYFFLSKELAEYPVKVLQINRFSYIIIHPGLQEPFPVTGLGMGGYCDNGNIFLWAYGS